MTLLRQVTTVYRTRQLREGTALTSEVDLTNPANGATTQEDANQIFVARLDALEADAGIDPGVIDCGSY